MNKNANANIKFSQQIAALLRQQDGQMVQLTVGRPIQVQETEMNSTPS